MQAQFIQHFHFSKRFTWTNKYAKTKEATVEIRIYKAIYYTAFFFFPHVFFSLFMALSCKATLNIALIYVYQKNLIESLFQHKQLSRFSFYNFFIADLLISGIFFIIFIQDDSLDKSSHWGCSMEKGVLGNFVKFRRKYLCQSLFFHKVTGLFYRANLSRPLIM